MKKTVTLLSLFLSLVFMSTGCSNDDDLELKKGIYYVKYSFTCGNSLHLCSFVIKYTDGNLQTSSKSYGKNPSASKAQKSYTDEIICGPFNYGDHVELEITNAVNVYNRSLEISVSKDNSPFALKVSGSSHLSYDIE